MFKYNHHLLCPIDIIDPAVLRPGRLDKTLYVGLPNLSDRKDILVTLTKVLLLLLLNIYLLNFNRVSVIYLLLLNIYL